MLAAYATAISMLPLIFADATPRHARYFDAQMIFFARLRRYDAACAITPRCPFAPDLRYFTMLLMPHCFDAALRHILRRYASISPRCHAALMPLPLMMPRYIRYGFITLDMR